MGHVLTINVTHHKRDGLHVLKSSDVPGLMVANRDFEAVLRDLGPSVEMCFKLNKGLDVEFLGVVQRYTETNSADIGEQSSQLPAWMTDAIHEVAVRRR